MADAHTSTGPDEATNAVAKKHQNNPYLKHIDRAPYELGCLLRHLPRTDRKNPLTLEDYQIADAAACHARNSISTLLWGLGAVGGIMADLCNIEPGHYDMEVSKVVALGELIKHIAVEIEFLNHTEGEMQEEMRLGHEGAKGGK